MADYYFQHKNELMQGMADNHFKCRKEESEENEGQSVKMQPVKLNIIKVMHKDSRKIFLVQ